jgi:EAL domain-containing protein (putative c-di-GMP-specific phosphodiesterase class I)
MAAPVTLDGRLVALGVSVGIAMYPRDGADFETLLKRAGSAMQRAKDLGRNTFQFYHAPLQGDARERVAIAGALRHALDGRQQMQVHYQPQLELGTGRVVGFEALMRWRHPMLGEVPPEKFIRVAETNGYMGSLGAWVTEQACAQLRALTAAGLEHATMSVNVSVAQLHDPHFSDRLLEALAQSGIAPQRLDLEVTESVLLQDRDLVLQHLARLRDAGLGVSIDDFGTGYSSLAYLTRFPVASLKIDRSFVAGIGRETSDPAIVRTIIEMARTLGFTVIAEGVETQAQVEFLRQFGCHQAQGYFFARPMPIEDFRALISAATEGASGKPSPAARYQ